MAIRRLNLQINVFGCSFPLKPQYFDHFTGDEEDDPGIADIKSYFDAPLGTEIDVRVAVVSIEQVQSLVDVDISQDEGHNCSGR